MKQIKIDDFLKRRTKTENDKIKPRPKYKENIDRFIQQPEEKKEERKGVK